MRNEVQQFIKGCLALENGHTSFFSIQNCFSWPAVLLRIKICCSLVESFFSLHFPAFVTKIGNR